MKLVQQIAVTILCLALAIAIAAGTWRLAIAPETAHASKTDKPASAATVAKVVKEEDLNTVVLTPEAERRLGIETGAVSKKSLSRVRVYGGEVAIPTGRSAIVSAPISGILQAPSGGLPIVGQPIRANQTVFELLPLLTPDSRITIAASLVDADARVNNAQAQLDAAKIALERAQRLFKQDAGSQRAVDEARAAYDLAEKTLEGTTSQRTMLAKATGDIAKGVAAPLAIRSPQNGILRNLSAMPGQTVPSGGVLFEAADLSIVWIRALLPAGELDQIDRSAPARVSRLAAGPNDERIEAKLLTEAPPSADPVAATVDVFYEVPNPAGHFSPGQRLAVAIPLKEPAETLVAPWSAVVFDIHGGAWVYEKTAELAYRRRRVVVDRVNGEEAVLASGPAPGALVATAGAQELFGAETGFIK